MNSPPTAKTAWITGASSGIGYALAQVMAADGWRVAASARNAEKLDELRGSIGNGPGQILPIPMDVTDPGSVERGIEQVREALGTPHLAVLNAGTHQPTPVEQLSAADFRRLMELNVMGTVHCLEAVIPDMIARRSGHIAIVASLAGYIGLPTAAAYGLTKAGLINMAEALKPELEGHQVKLQLVNPGFVKTPLTDLNPFSMPFLMELDAAADAFYRGLRSNAFEIVFPRRFAYLMKLFRLLPYPLTFALSRKLVPG